MLITESELMAWSGYEQRPRLARWLSEQGIAYFVGKGGAICTTALAINNRLTETRIEASQEIDFA